MPCEPLRVDCLNSGHEKRNFSFWAKPRTKFNGCVLAIVLIVSVNIINKKHKKFISDIEDITERSRIKPLIKSLVKEIHKCQQTRWWPSRFSFGIRTLVIIINCSSCSRIKYKLSASNSLKTLYVIILHF